MLYDQYGTTVKRSAMEDNLTPPLQPGGLDAFSSKPEGNAEVKFLFFLPLLQFLSLFYFCTWTHEWSSPELRHCIVRQAIVDDQAKDRCVAANLKFQIFNEKVLKWAHIPEVSNLPWKNSKGSSYTRSFKFTMKKSYKELTYPVLDRTGPVGPMLLCVVPEQAF